MNKILLLSVLLIPVVSKAQPAFPADSSTHKITYQTQHSNSLLKLELYPRVKDWFANSLIQSEDILPEDNDVNWYITGKGCLVCASSSAPANQSADSLQYSILVDCRDKGYSCVITDIEIKPHGEAGYYPLEKWKDNASAVNATAEYQTITSKFKELIQSFDIGMASVTSANYNDDF